MVFLLEGDEWVWLADRLQTGAFSFGEVAGGVSSAISLVNQETGWSFALAEVCGMMRKMKAPPVDLSGRVIQAFPSWLDLPPGYIVNDWIAWQKGKLVAARLREHPEWLAMLASELSARQDHLFAASLEWLELLRSGEVEKVASILESPDPEGQRLRSSAPFRGERFVKAEEMEAIRERAYLG